MKKKRVLIIGHGLLGRALEESAWVRSGACVIATRHPSAVSIRALDISKDSSVRDFFRKDHAFDAVMNCAAMTDVDGCERDPLTARNLNGLAVKRLAEVSRARKIPLVHVSTNYVFSGRKRSPYTEEDVVDPNSIYGLTKLEGEFYALHGNPLSAVVRTSWIFGPGKADFVNKALEKFEKGETVSAIGDQLSSATYAKDLAQALGLLVSRLFWENTPLTWLGDRIYNLTNAGGCTRFDMIQCMARVLKRRNRLVRLEKKDLTKWAAVRPDYSVMSCCKFECLTGHKLRSWKDALTEYLSGIR